MDIKLNEMKNCIIKTGFFLLTFIIFLSCASNKRGYIYLGGSAPNRTEDLLITTKDYLKGYAMCKCLDLAYKKDSINLNDRSVSFLKEMAEDLITQKIDSVISGKAKEYVYRAKKGSTPADGADKNLLMVDCLFFSESKQLKKTIDSSLKDFDGFTNYWNSK